MIAFITGTAGSGKTTELATRIRQSAANAAVLVTAGAASSLEGLRRHCVALRQAQGDTIGAQDDIGDRDHVANANVHFQSIEEIALSVLRDRAKAGGTSDLELIDDVRAALLFERAAEPLLLMEWSEFLEAQLDPEVPGMRAPRRFLEAAFRLFCKLRDATISPPAFLEAALRGATSFYGKPPNFAHPDLLAYTKDSHHSSLIADAPELERQYRREIDLAKILAKLYASYLERLVERGCLTTRDAIAEAITAIQKDGALAVSFRGRYANLFVDDAQELTLGAIQLFAALYGDQLEGVTAAGDPDSAISTFAGARPDRAFALGGERFVCSEHQRSPFAIDLACRHLLGSGGGAAMSVESEIALRLFRASTKRAEAQFVAEHVGELLRDGAAPEKVALIFRSVRQVGIYRDALLEGNIRVEVSGDLNLFSEPDVLDALALLWFAHDPFRHEYLLRILSGEAMALSDASLAAICSQPDDGQELLFEELAQDESDARSARIDAQRKQRLGLNVTLGEVDSMLSPVALERIRELRKRRVGWLELVKTENLADFSRQVWNEGLARAGQPRSARAAYQQSTLRRLHDRIATFVRKNPSGTLGEFLEDAEARAGSEFESCGTVLCHPEPVEGRQSAVHILSLDAARGLEFDHVVIPNVRAGSFPRWYVPDAFLYSPSLGMIAKENVGDAQAARTAKFSDYMFRTKTREAYNREERRAFVYALRRAKRTALVTASERATRGIAAPELLYELQAARLPGVLDVSDKWRPSSGARAG